MHSEVICKREGKVVLEKKRLVRQAVDDWFMIFALLSMISSGLVFSFYSGTTRLDELGMFLFSRAFCVIRFVCSYNFVVLSGLFVIATDRLIPFIYPGYKKRFAKPAGPRSHPADWPCFGHLGL